MKRLVLALLLSASPAFAQIPNAQSGGGLKAGSLDTSAEIFAITTDEQGSGELLGSVLEIEASVAGSGAPNVLLSTESGKTLTNEGATAEAYNTLPAAAAGLNFCFEVLDDSGLRVTAAGDDTIRLGAYASAAAGYVTSSDIGLTLCVKALNATQWVGRVEGSGYWSIDGGTRYHGAGLYSVVTNFTATNIVGTDVEDLGHAEGVTVHAAVAGKRIVPVEAVLRYTFATGAYTGGGNTSLNYWNGSSLDLVSEVASSGNAFADANSSCSTVLTHQDSPNNGATSTFGINQKLVFQAATAYTAGAGAGTGVLTTYFYLRDS